MDILKCLKQYSDVDNVYNIIHMFYGMEVGTHRKIHRWANRNMKVDIDHIGNKTHVTIITFNRYLWDWNTFWVLLLLDALLLLVPYGLWPSRWFIDFFIPILPAISSLGLEFIPPLNTNGLKKKSVWSQYTFKNRRE